MRSDDMDTAYVLCVLGESPTVLTNLLWWLAALEKRPVAGIEVWATGSGIAHLRRLVATDEWAALQKVTGPQPQLQTDGDESSRYGFRAHPHTLDDTVLNDIRSAEEARSVNACLHDRVRQLREELPETTQLIGCLAGGRKTVSAALQTAFCLQARAQDRLVHVVFDARLEEALRAARTMGDYAFPDPDWETLAGVPPEEQIVVYDVPFPRLRYLVPRRLSEVLDAKRWAEVWPTLEANVGRDARGVLVRRGVQSWRYDVRDQASGEVLYTKRLKRRLGATMAALASAPPDATALDLVAWLDGHEVGWAPPAASQPDASELRAGPMRSAVSTLRKALADLPMGLEAFAPGAKSLVVERVDVIDEWSGV